MLMVAASHNRLGALSLSADGYLPVLDVSHNEIGEFDLAIQDLLAFADLSHNKLTNVLDAQNPDLRRLRGLSYLDLSHNAVPALQSLFLS